MGKWVFLEEGSCSWWKVGSGKDLVYTAGSAVNDLRKPNVQREMDSSLKRNRASYGFVSEFNVSVLFSCYEEQGKQFVFV
jgi:hypothetical protein